MQYGLKKHINIDEHRRVAKTAQELQRVAKELQTKNRIKLVVASVYE